jgi:hypothetical protein
VEKTFGNQYNFFERGPTPKNFGIWKELGDRKVLSALDSWIMGFGGGGLGVGV